MAAGLRGFLYRHRLPLALLYLLLVGSMFYGTAYYLDGQKVPAAVDLGLTIAGRSMAYQRTFAELDRARRERDQGHPADAVARLERFLASTQGTQQAQLSTHAVTDAHELLAELYEADGRTGRAVAVLESACERFPLNYWMWYRLGRILEERGELGKAQDALTRAFHLVPELPLVADAYLKVLSEQLDHERILWVHDQFQRAQQRAAPQVEVKVGQPRDALQRQVLGFVGIPVEQASFFRSCRLTGLRRGPRQRLLLPAEITMDWPAGEPRVTIQLRFEGIYEGLQLTALCYTTAVGERVERALASDEIRYLHRPHSGAEFYAEFDTGVAAEDLRDVEVEYSCPRFALSPECEAIFAHARRNRTARGGGP